MNGALDSFMFVLEGRPRPKERPRLGRGGRVFTPKRTHQQEQAMAVCAMNALPSGWHLNATYAVEMRFYFKGGVLPDIDNLIKIIDGLNGVVWDDDRQVTEIQAMRLNRPEEVERTVVQIHRMSEPKPRKVSKPRAKAGIDAADKLMGVFGLKRVNSPRKRVKRARKRKVVR